jgi:hypothetical protein
MIKRERDPNLVGLESNIFSKMNEILGPDIKQPVPKTDVKFVSFEDALKELLELEKTNVVPTLTSSQ